MSRLVYPDPICIGLPVPTQPVPRPGAPSSAVDPSSESGTSLRLASRHSTSALGAVAVKMSSRLNAAGNKFVHLDDAVGVACLVGTAVTDKTESRKLWKSSQQIVVLAEHSLVTSYGPNTSVYRHLKRVPEDAGLKLRSLEPRPM